MSLLVLALFIASSSFFLALRHLNQSVTNYYDMVAFFMVFGGTIAVGVVLLPWSLRADLKKAFFDLIKTKHLSYHTVLTDCLESIRSRSVRLSSESASAIYAQILNDGYELIQLGISKDKLNEILSERLNQYGKRKRKISNAIKSLAKYPPAFGLIGTVLGLVNVMKGVSNGLSGKETALEMSVALVATMYGLVVANLIVNPSGELLAKKTIEDEAFGEIAINAVLLMAEKASFLESHEILNSYAPLEQRINLLTDFSQDVAS